MSHSCSEYETNKQKRKAYKHTEERKTKQTYCICSIQMVRELGLFINPKDMFINKKRKIKVQKNDKLEHKK